MATNTGAPPLGSIPGMSNEVDFDALPASVRTALVEARAAHKNRETRQQSLLLGSHAGGGYVFGTMFAGLLLSPLIVLAMWFWAGGPLDAAEHLPVPLALVSLWFFSAIAYVVHDVRASGVRAVLEGTHLYAGTLLVVEGSRVWVSELAPGARAEVFVSTGTRTTNVYKGGRRYIKTVKGSTSYLHIHAMTTSGEPVELSFGPDPVKEEPKVADRLNDRFARWSHARRAGDFRTMASLDPFTECYATQRLALQPPDPAGPKMNLMGAAPAIPLYAGAFVLALVPLIVGLALG